MLGNSWTNKEKLFDLYTTQKLSTFEIGKLFKVSAPSVRYWLLKWGFYIRNKSESQIGDNNHGWVGGKDQQEINKLKRYAIEYKSLYGCSKCGYKKCSNALEFHHINPDEKDFFITRDGINNFGLLLKEIKKCMIVCSNCHNEIHYHTPGKYKGKKYISVWNKFQEMKRLKGCSKCGYASPAGLEFHHRDKTTKLFTIGRSVNYYKPWEELISEINKCDIICCNCHREEEARVKKSGSTIIWNYSSNILGAL